MSSTTGPVSVTIKATHINFLREVTLGGRRTSSGRDLETLRGHRPGPHRFNNSVAVVDGTTVVHPESGFMDGGEETLAGTTKTAGHPGEGPTSRCTPRHTDGT